MSTAILQLSENGDLQKIHDKWISRHDCAAKVNDDVDSNELSLSSFWGLFLICGIACFLSLIAFFVRVFCQYMKFIPEDEEVDQENPSNRPSGTFRSSKSFKELIIFVDKKEKEIKEILRQKSKKRRRGESLDDQSSSQSPMDAARV